jgi:hypothetical protein
MKVLLMKVVQRAVKKAAMLEMAAATSLKGMRRPKQKNK